MRLPDNDPFAPTRRSLIARLQDAGDQDGWRSFFATYWRLIYSVARKSGLDDGEAQDLVQETVLSVSRKIAGFRYDPALGTFKNWLMLITRSPGLDMRPARSFITCLKTRLGYLRAQPRSARNSPITTAASM